MERISRSGINETDLALIKKILGDISLDSLAGITCINEVQGFGHANRGAAHPPTPIAAFIFRTALLGKINVIILYRKKFAKNPILEKIREHKGCAH